MQNVPKVSVAHSVLGTVSTENLNSCVHYIKAVFALLRECLKANKLPTKIDSARYRCSVFSECRLLGETQRRIVNNSSHIKANLLITAGEPAYELPNHSVSLEVSII